MTQQTAVDWLIEQLVNLDKQLDGRRKSDDSTVIKINPTKIYEQAKQMEKEQIMKTYDDASGYFSQPETAEEYYEITYSGNISNFGGATTQLMSDLQLLIPQYYNNYVEKYGSENFTCWLNTFAGMEEIKNRDSGIIDDGEAPDTNTSPNTQNK